MIGKKDRFWYKEFFFFLLLFSMCASWKFYTDINIYYLRNYGQKTSGLIKIIEIDSKNQLEIKYLYHVSGKDYTGNRFYKKIPYDINKIQEIRNEIMKTQIFSVYFCSKNPSKAICFITSEDFEFIWSILVVLLLLWGIWGFYYLQIRIWNNK